MIEALPALMFIFLLFFLFLGYPLAFVLGGLAVFFGLIGFGPTVFDMFVLRTWGVMISYILVAVPLFVFMAMMLERSGIADDLFSAMHLWMGPVRGGIALGINAICTLMASTTGIVGTAVVSMSLIGLPAMLKRGYQAELAAGVVMAGGTLGIIIPPSIMLVILGDMMGLSVGRLFIGALFPGMVLSGLYAAYILTRSYLQPHLAPALPKEERVVVPWSRKLWVLLTAMLPPLFLIFAVLGTIFFGVATPTEAAGMGAVGAMLIALARRRLTMQAIAEASLATMRLSSMVFIILLGASAFAGVFIGTGGGKLAEGLLLSLPFGRWGVLLGMLFIIFILGMFLDWIGIIFITLPIFMPIIKTLGFDPLWFGVVLAVNLQNSYLTPPFGYAIFYVKGVAGESISTPTLYRAVAPFIALQLLGLTAVLLLPSLVLWLPDKMIG